MSLVDAQRAMNQRGLDVGTPDGIWGPRTERAWQTLLEVYDRAQLAIARPTAARPLAWSTRVSPAFCDKVRAIAAELRMPADGANWLMACMAWESAEKFSPNVINMAGSGATGLIQFMPATALGLGTTVSRLALMTAEEQLEYVLRYFKPYAGRLQSLGDVYMAILWPAAIGKPDGAALWDQTSRPTTYRQNAGLDLDRDGAITRGEAVAKVAEKLQRGLLPINASGWPA